MVDDVSKELLKFLNRPMSIISVSVFLIGLYICTFLFSIPMSSEMKPFSISFIENTSWTTLIVLLFVNFFKFVFDISIVDYFNEKELEKALKEYENRNRTFGKV